MLGEVVIEITEKNIKFLRNNNWIETKKTGYQGTYYMQPTY